MSRGIIKNPPSIWVECPDAIVLLAPWGEKLKVNLVSRLGLRSSNGKILQSSSNLWSMMCRILAEEKGSSDIFFLRIGPGDLIKPTRVNKGFPIRKVNRFGLICLYHIRRVDSAWCTLFDSEFYLKENPDVAEAGVDPLIHFLWLGAQEMRNPNPLFDVAYYLHENPDVAESGVNPLAHFIERGAQEMRNPHPLFNIADYLRDNPDVAESGVNPLVHYLDHVKKTKEPARLK
jgi:hypothetical protein